MKKSLHLFLVLLICVLCFSYSFPNKVFAENNNYSAQIQQYIELMYTDSTQNRTAGSDGEKEMANLLCEFLNTCGYEYFQSSSYKQEFNFAGKTSCNVIGFKNVGAEKTIVVGAHYDSHYIAGQSYGYNDNLSGVVAVMTLAKVLATQTDVNLVIAFWGAEELGMLGSNYYVNHLDENFKKKIALYINFDTIGAGDYRYYYTCDFSTEYGKQIDKAFKNKNIKRSGSEIYGIKSVNNINYTVIPLQSDNSEFLKAGINSLSFFTGNLNSNNGLGFFETKSHPEIMHNTDSKKTIDEVFGTEHFVENINFYVMLVYDFVEESNFANGSYEGEQVFSWVYNPIILKVVCSGLIACGFVIFCFINKKLNKKIISKK